jgi:hypothetical protein
MWTDRYQKERRKRRACATTAHGWVSNRQFLLRMVHSCLALAVLSIILSSCAPAATESSPQTANHCMSL